MIEIKMRVHDGVHMHYCTLDSYPDLINSDSFNGGKDNLSSSVKMLCINKYDANNQLIYFGDVVEFVDSHIAAFEKYIVSYDEYSKEVVLKNNKGLTVFKKVNWSQVEVIGNYIDDEDILI